MSKRVSLLKRVVKRLAEIEPSRKKQKSPKLVHVNGRIHGEPREPLDFESVESDRSGEQRDAAGLEPAEGRYYGERRVAADFMPADRRYRGWPQSSVNLEEEQDRETPDYVEYWRAIKLRKWSILSRNACRHHRLRGCFADGSCLSVQRHGVDRD